MDTRSDSGVSAVVPVTRRYGLPLSERPALPDADAEGITEDLIRDVVLEFYRRAHRDARIGPVFEAHVDDWNVHLVRMNDFWSAALLRTGRYSGRPAEQHRAIEGLAAGHFDRWIELFEETVRDLCPAPQADAFLVRAKRMRDGLIMVLGLDHRPSNARATVPHDRGNSRE